MSRLGRVLQILGLTVLPVALLLNLTPFGRNGEPILTVGQQMLALVACGVVAFWIGRILEAYSKP